MKNGKFKIWILVAVGGLIASIAAAVPGDFDASGCVDTDDLQTFAASWLTDDGGDLDSDADTDLADFAVFAGYWLDGCPTPPEGGTPPTASNQSPAVVTHVWQAITLAATDDGHPVIPGKMRYLITSLPTVGQIYDPKSGAGKISKVPYTLSSWGNTVSYWTTTAGSDSFQFRADDCGISPNGQSNTATVTIIATANPKDCLSFDGRGYVSIPDGTYLDAVDGWAIDFWIKTRQPYATLVKKRSIGAGYEIKLVGGVPCVEFYTASGDRIVLMESAGRIDDGQWHEIGLHICNYTTGWLIRFWAGTDELQIINPMPDFSNTEPVIVGMTYKNQLDKLRFFTGLTDPTSLSAVPLGERTDTTYESVFGIGAVSAVHFYCNEAAGTTITDAKTGKIGTFNSADHVSWLPYFDPFMDVSVQQNYRGAK